MSEPKQPRRAFELTITIGADTWRSVEDELAFLAIHIPDHGPKCDSVMGGPCRNHIVSIHHDPEMTHDRYHEELQAYLDARKP